MRQLSSGEEWVRRVVERALGVRVRQYDDGSAPSMFDLLIEDADGPRGAMEVTTATDSTATAFWRHVTKRGEWSDPRLTGGWMVWTRPDAQVSRLRRRLAELLADFEARGWDAYEEPEVWQGRPYPMAAELGVFKATHLATTENTGRIFIMPPEPSEDARFVATLGEVGHPLADWAVAWLQEPGQRDNLDKLARATTAERHLFVALVSLTSAPDDAVMTLLTSDVPVLPDRPPRLPKPITHLWLASGWDVPHGIRWSPDRGWSLFPAGSVR
jgi:hypothetical protein